jgi:hypothetical protein
LREVVVTIGEKGEGIRIQAKAQTPIPPLSGGEVARETEEKGRGLFKRRVTITLLPAVSRSITGCFATQNIGEVSEGRRD